MKTTTSAQNLINSFDSNALASRMTRAEANGMTLEQLAASEITLANRAVITSPEFAAVAKDKALCLAVFDKIAQIPETDKGSSYIPTEQLIAAFKN